MIPLFRIPRPLVEETHYYAFGLTMSGISSKAMKTNYAENKYQFVSKEKQSKEFSDGGSLETYDFGSRFYDPQIARWHIPDLHASKYLDVTPYSYVFNNPMVLIDPRWKRRYIV